MFVVCIAICVATFFPLSSLFSFRHTCIEETQSLSFLAGFLCACFYVCFSVYVSIFSLLMHKTVFFFYMHSFSCVCFFACFSVYSYVFTLMHIFFCLTLSHAGREQPLRAEESRKLGTWLGAVCVCVCMALRRSETRRLCCNFGCLLVVVFGSLVGRGGSHPFILR